MLKALWKIWRKTINNTKKIKNELIIVFVATGSHNEILGIG